MQTAAFNSTSQAVAYTGTAASSTAFGSQTYYIRIAANSACHYAIGTAPTAAAASDAFLPANWVEYVKVRPGQKISFVRAGTDGLVTATSGTAFVTELTD